MHRVQSAGVSKRSWGVGRLDAVLGETLDPESVELSIIVPTYNETANIRELVKRLHDCLEGLSWEVIFVDDDSSDGTAGLIRQIARSDPRVRCLHRIGRRGLSSACIEGMLASSAGYFAVMDADLQHDETLLPRMLQILKAGDTEIVVASRFSAGGSVGDFEKSRVSISKLGARLSRLILRAELSDPMSGFFMLRSELFGEVVRSLSGIGFKILLDIFGSAPRKLRFQEVPYTFRSRFAGESKLDSRALLDYQMLIFDKLFGKVLPVRFIAFSLVGATGVLVHLVVLSLLFRGLDLGFTISQVAATAVAMVSNFALNNMTTYRDRRLHGRAWLRGLLVFALACGIGAAANVAVAAMLFEAGTYWMLGAVAGILIGAVWNYAVTAVYTWSK